MCISYATFYIGNCAPLQVDVAGRNDSTLCIGDNVTYTCTVPTPAHTWNIQPVGLNTAITRSTPMITSTFGGILIQIRIIQDQGGSNPITTTLSLIAFAGLNGTTVQCQDSDLAEPAQESVAKVLGEFHAL